MKLTRLRIVGFKTFVEPTEVLIEPGLTGVVGPNGCGKSNLVEALRWVMGESSHKNMRATGMDDVIFAGSSSRPARNTAEVTLAIDNADKQAPAAFNDADALEVSRRIERSHGSSYHVNGREVRARDVQLLFADAATGARSPALVRQGQISELIAAKPQARRRILEDAAGIAGLHARRHEAELRLRQAEENLLRVEDVLREIETQVTALQRQGRQAARYRNLSAEIRLIDARLAAAAWLAAERERAEAEAAEREDVRAVADATTSQAEAARLEAVAAHEVGPLREAQGAASAALRRLVQAKSDLDGEEKRAAQRLTDLERRIVEIERDAARQTQLRQDAADTIARLDKEATDLAETVSAASSRREGLEGGLSDAEADLARAETALAAVQAEAAEQTAKRSALQREAAAETERAERGAKEVARLLAEKAALEASRQALGTAPLGAAREAAEIAAKEAEDAVSTARQALAAAREAEARERGSANEAERAAQRLETEHRTLVKLFAASPGKRFPTMLDAMRVEPGCETAVAAALGDDLDASPDLGAPLAWHDTGSGESDPPLPGGAAPLAGFVSGPPALTRRLRQIGLVTRDEASALKATLAPGQRLVTREGDLWRWDGLAAAAEAPSPAARRLAERNRLAGLETEATEARRIADDRRTVAAAAEAATREASRAEGAAIEAAKRARRAFDEAREALARAERQASEGAARLSALTEAIGRVEAGERDARVRAGEARMQLAALPDGTALETRHLEARAVAAEQRARVADGRAALGALTREQEAASRRREALAADIRSWRERSERSIAAASDLAERAEAAAAERQELRDAPDTFAKRRSALAVALKDAEARRSEAADRLSGADRRVQDTARAARAALEALSGAREKRAASAALTEALGRRVAELGHAVEERFETSPRELAIQSGLNEATAFDAAAAEARLAVLKVERERLGGVNLRAEEELEESESKRDRLAAERDDLTEAIKRLRQAIGNLNREGRERLNTAFGIVSGHFKRLFTTLFGGGEAELTLVDSDDPLEAGLEIVARPPGKKPQSLSLLSGGEQALTATALIFAVFLTNPSPICVLDEVDAPLDDANVERYCDLLQQMASETDTRFVVITHNPITMARMDRLFGVTMAERGMSQLVSVDLQAAERLRDAG
ncbi:chromosome segregation SMC family protein [Enterovirga rhinocerotis]|uniref:Chromosome partition protein Smc n=1 Tax=Enterovirga rhinocerotis TaxID=1339210 RepID=A0A4R7C5D9_9HYPH|nr:AAA family ATPase [Enterovirga rhinocerotis]TDR93774.1 condensin subunit Smc [Enterovirga rhinocerotis]